MTKSSLAALRDNGQLIAITDQPKRFGVSPVRVAAGIPLAALDLTQAKWHLSADDWQPVNPSAAQTQKTRIDLDLDGLKPWPQIPSLEHASGLGTYTTTFNLPAVNSAILSLGEVFDTFTLTVNSRPVSNDQLSGKADIGPHLKPGPNTISVPVATTLNNRLAVLDDDVKARPQAALRPRRPSPPHPRQRQTST